MIKHEWVKRTGDYRSLEVKAESFGAPAPGGTPTWFWTVRELGQDGIELCRWSGSLPWAGVGGPGPRDVLAAMAADLRRLDEQWEGWPWT